MEHSEQTASDFIQFCVARRGNQWPALYDEMCRVAARRLYKGMGYTELREAGICLGLGGLDKTARLIDRLNPSPNAI